MGNKKLGSSEVRPDIQMRIDMHKDRLRALTVMTQEFGLSLEEVRELVGNKSSSLFSIWRTKLMVKGPVQRAFDAVAKQIGAWPGHEENRERFLTARKWGRGQNGCGKPTVIGL